MSTGMSSLLKILFVNSLCNAANLADFHLKCSILMENPKSNILGSNAFLVVFTHSVKETSSNDKKRLTDRLSHLRKEF